MLKSVSIWALQENDDRPARELFAEARRCGFDGVELAVGDAGLLTPESTEADCSRLLNDAQQEGIEVTSLASGLGWQYPLSARDPEVRAKGLQIQKKALQLGSWLGIRCLLVVPGMVSGPGAEGPEHVPYDVAYENMNRSVAELIPTAEETGVLIGIENVWNKILMSPVEMRQFIDGFDSPWVRSYFDVGNVLRTGYAEDWVRILGERIAGVHFKDYQRSIGTLAGFCPLLEGDANYAAVMEELRDIGYHDACVAEFFELDPDELSAVAEAMDHIAQM
jgi:hexulose-6-phosphate isomerase